MKKAPKKPGRKPAAKKPAKKPPKKAELKTKVNAASVSAFLDKQGARRDDCRALDALFSRATGDKGRMWGTSIVGYGSYVYTSPATGRSGDWMEIGFSPRAQNLTLYLMDGFSERQALLARLGPHSTGKSCLYIKRLADIDTAVLEQLVQRSVAAMRARPA